MSQPTPMSAVSIDDITLTRRLLSVVPQVLFKVCEGEAGHEDSALLVPRLQKFFDFCSGYTLLDEEAMVDKMCDIIRRECVHEFRQGWGIRTLSNGPADVGAGPDKNYFFQGFWFGSSVGLKFQSGGYVQQCAYHECNYALSRNNPDGVDRPANFTIPMTWDLAELTEHKEFYGGMFEGILSIPKGMYKDMHILCFISSLVRAETAKFSDSLSEILSAAIDHEGLGEVVEALAANLDEEDVKADTKQPAPPQSARAPRAGSQQTQKCVSCRIEYAKTCFSRNQLKKKKKKARCLTCVQADQIAPQQADEAPPPLPVGAIKTPATHADPCSICLSAPRLYAFAPCGHMVACAACAEQVMRYSSRCPHCRTQATSFMRIYNA